MVLYFCYHDNMSSQPNCLKMHNMTHNSDASIKYTTLSMILLFFLCLLTLSKTHGARKGLQVLSNHCPLICLDKIYLLQAWGFISIIHFAYDRDSNKPFWFSLCITCDLCNSLVFIIQGLCQKVSYLVNRFSLGRQMSHFSGKSIFVMNTIHN